MKRSTPVQPDPAITRSRRWREAVRIEDRIARIQSTCEQAQLEGDLEPALLRQLVQEIERLRAEQERLVLLEGLSWPLRADLHADVLAQLERVDRVLVRAAPEPAVVRAILAQADLS